MELNYCPRCGAPLHLREHPTDGQIQYCDACGDYRYPLFSAAVSVVVVDRDMKNTLLIRQYGKPQDVLVAGYVDKGERAEHAVRRELMEELGLEAERIRFLGSHYYEPSETLMLNFAAVVGETEAHPNWEVDSWRWLSLEEARRSVKPQSLAETLLNDFFEPVF